MWRKGRKREDDSGGGELGPAAKFSRTNFDDGNGDIVVCELSKSRRVTVRNWQGKVVVDIREFYVKDGKELPGKKGKDHHHFKTLVRRTIVLPKLGSLV